MQAVNKLAEIMNRKDMRNPGRKNKVSSADLRKREKECRKLQQELTQVWIISYSIMKSYERLDILSCVTVREIF